MKIGGMVLFVLVLSVEETTYMCVCMCGARLVVYLSVAICSWWLWQENHKWDKRERLNKFRTCAATMMRHGLVFIHTFLETLPYCHVY